MDACAADPHPIEWIDEYVRRIRPYVRVRAVDSLLIKLPNEAHRLNPSGTRVLARLLDGEDVVHLWRSHGATAEVRRDLYQFFVALKQVLQGCMDETRPPEAAEVRPFAFGFNTLPVLSEIALTYRCNLRCRFCYAGCGCTRGDGSGEMGTRDARRVLRVIRDEAQVPSVSFTGGEPTLRDDLPALVRHARRGLGLRVNLITNGTLIDDALAGTLARAGLDSAQVSLEAPEAGVHDRLTTVPGSFERTLRGLASLRRAGIRVHTNTTLNRWNLAEAPRMPAFVRSLGLERFSMNLMIPTGTACGEGADLLVRYREIPDVIRALARESARAGVEFLWYSPTPVCLFNPVQHRLGNKSCAACDGLLSVSPRGAVLPCSSWATPVGDLLRRPFREVWASRRSAWIRAKRFAPRACRGCEEFALCQGACPLYWRRFGCGELEAGTT